MTKKIYIKLLVVIQIMVLGVMLISCEKDEKKDETGILLKQGAFVDEKDNYKTFNENDEGVYKEIDTNGKIINNYNLSSNTYTFFKDNSFYVNYNSEDIKINHDKIVLIFRYLLQQVKCFLISCFCLIIFCLIISGSFPVKNDVVSVLRYL